MPRVSDDPDAFRLADELRATVGALNRRFREQASARDLTTAQKSVLLRLERDGPATTTALARAEAMRPQSMGAILASLEAEGYVAAAPDPTDGRRTILSVTARWTEWAQSARAARRDWLFRAIQAELNPEDQKTVAAAIPLLRRLIAF
ncbi:MarR family transcriptional regulator [Acetobacteraceae bacterium KSS8]|uniref:MarR family transcriptional regulator n=1 Tax=Endosaccharibacter trunci TaxID=2812733 RepID=A0ABT1W4Q4_9PROT|nr:MarR family transcriptional regulator [Acetobacteraceae bacterium KSS8]